MAERAGEGIGCGQCWPAHADDAWAARARLTHVAELIDDTHLGVRVLACPSCRQQFVSVFVEFVDWVDGDDPQYVTMMPLSIAEAAGLLQASAAQVGSMVEGLDPDRRSLGMDHPKGGPKRIYWGAGVSLR